MSAIHMALRCARCKARLTIENAHVRADGVACYCVACVKPAAAPDPAPATPQEQAPEPAVVEPAQERRTCSTCAEPVPAGSTMCPACVASFKVSEPAPAPAPAPAAKAAKREKVDPAEKARAKAARDEDRKAERAAKRAAKADSLSAKIREANEAAKAREAARAESKARRVAISDMREPRHDPASVEPLALPREVLALRGVAAQERTRYAMDGVLVERADGQCRAVATNGKSLAVVEWRDTTEGGGGDVFSVVPVATLSEAEKVLRGVPKAERARTSEVPVTFNGRVIAEVPGKAGTVRLESRPVEGHYPPYRDVLPPRDRESIVLAFDAGLLYELAQSLAAATGREGLHVRLRLDRSKPDTAGIVVESLGEPSGSAVSGFGILMPVENE